MPLTCSDCPKLCCSVIIPGFQKIIAQKEFILILASTLTYRRICRKGLQYPSIGEYHLDITRLLSGIDPRLHHYCLLLTDVFSPPLAIKRMKPRLFTTPSLKSGSLHDLIRCKR
ncbi:unnamed protein product [Enterobius vermicularis]|uniref:Saposin B-type domain-containing protein n=1 Tax=Enterobius vermicularis TaxID=51028 RepID=A0A0N4V034_ENTVE|nr:unnamed protein product [Enterobius vermicularis]